MLEVNELRRNERSRVVIMKLFNILKRLEGFNNLEETTVKLKQTYNQILNSVNDLKKQSVQLSGLAQNMVEKITKIAHYKININPLLSALSTEENNQFEQRLNTFVKEIETGIETIKRNERFSQIITRLLAILKKLEASKKDKAITKKLHRDHEDLLLLANDRKKQGEYLSAFAQNLTVKISNIVKCEINLTPVLNVLPIENNGQFNEKLDIFIKDIETQISIVSGKDFDKILKIQQDKFKKDNFNDHEKQASMIQANSTLLRLIYVSLDTVQFKSGSIVSTAKDELKEKMFNIIKNYYVFKNGYNKEVAPKGNKKTDPEKEKLENYEHNIVTLNTEIIKCLNQIVHNADTQELEQLFKQYLQTTRGSDLSLKEFREKLANLEEDMGMKLAEHLKFDYKAAKKFIDPAKKIDKVEGMIKEEIERRIKEKMKSKFEPIETNNNNASAQDINFTWKKVKHTTQPNQNFFMKSRKNENQDKDAEDSKYNRGLS